MTREEAIDLLDNLIGMIEDNHNSDYDTALEMAIKALETIPKYKNAYNKGYDAGVKTTNVDCGVVWEERIDAIKADIDKQTEIHADGEFYIKNIDVKRIISKHCGGDKE